MAIKLPCSDIVLTEGKENSLTGQVFPDVHVKEVTDGLRDHSSDMTHCPFES